MTGKRIEQPDGAFESDDPHLPLLPWCRECWDQIANPQDDTMPEECPECGSSDVTLL